MADEHGHIKLSRKFFQSDPFWNEEREYSRAEAWIDLIRTATWKHRHERSVNGDVVTLRRGQLLASERFLADRWCWSRGKVRRYLGTLVDMDRVKLEKAHPADQLGARITLVNYDSYQAPHTQTGPPNGPPADHPRTKEKAGGKQGGKERGTTVGSLQEPPSVPPKKDGGSTDWPVPSDLPKESGRHVYPDAFEDIWAAYPDREGGDPKKAAYRKARACVNDGADPSELQEAVEHYADRMEHEGSTGTRYVMQAKKFFGPDDHWQEELELQEETPEDNVIRSDEEFDRFYGLTA